MKKLLLFTLMFSFHLAAHAQEAFSTLEERMSGKEFKETGLSKLTDAELATLNEWVRSHSVATLENAAARPASAATAASYAGETTDTRGFENQPKMNDDNDGFDDTIHSNIAGTFTGWSGTDTEFKLANGMVWKQVEGDTFNVKATENAEITIKKTMMGAWRLSMVGYNNTVRVKRIQ
jgi:hypothetical protein